MCKPNATIADIGTSMSAHGPNELHIGTCASTTLLTPRQPRPAKGVSQTMASAGHCLCPPQHPHFHTPQSGLARPAIGCWETALRLRRDASLLFPRASAQNLEHQPRTGEMISKTPLAYMSLLHFAAKLASELVSKYQKSLHFSSCPLYILHTYARAYAALYSLTTCVMP